MIILWICGKLELERTPLVRHAECHLPVNHLSECEYNFKCVELQKLYGPKSVYVCGLYLKNKMTYYAIIEILVKLKLSGYDSSSSVHWNAYRDEVLKIIT